jgi:hypothetical protein
MIGDPVRNLCECRPSGWRRTGNAETRSSEMNFDFSSIGEAIEAIFAGVIQQITELFSGLFGDLIGGFLG